MKLLVDPILVGNLDFGIPFLFDGAKKFLKNFKVKKKFVLLTLLFCFYIYAEKVVFGNNIMLS